MLNFTLYLFSLRCDSSIIEAYELHTTLNRLDGFMAFTVAGKAEENPFEFKQTLFPNEKLRPSSSFGKLAMPINRYSDRNWPQRSGRLSCVFLAKVLLIDDCFCNFKPVFLFPFHCFCCTELTIKVELIINYNQLQIAIVINFINLV